MTANDKPDTELKACWTCRARGFAEITHTSNDYAGTLFRCVNCKAIYPDFALRTPPPPVDRTAVLEEAAKVVERGGFGWEEGDLPSTYRSRIAAAIRALSIDHPTGIATNEGDRDD